MHPDHDPLDGALEALRTQHWTCDSHNTKLEETLMKAYQSPPPGWRFSRRNTLVAVLGVLLVGGGTFAATGGVETIKSWLVTVEINGEMHELALDEAGSGTFTIDTDDGGQAEVLVEVASSPEEGERRTIRISAGTPGGNGTEDVETLCEKRVVISGQASADGTYTVEDLGDAEPAAEWQQDGTLSQVYLIPNAEDEADGFMVFLASSDEGGETTVVLAAAPSVALPDNDEDISAEVTHDGLLTIRIAPDEGREMVMKFMVAGDGGPEGCCDPDAPLSVATPDGEITVTIEATEAPGAE